MRDGRTLKSVLFPASAGDRAIHATAWTQPALFAVEYAMTELWRSWGIDPAAVIGHSVGEYVAACVAGVFSLEDGLRLIAERGRLMQALPAGGDMAAVFAPVEDVIAALAPMAEQLAIAAINAPESVVISGVATAVNAVVAEFASRGVRAHKLAHLVRGALAAGRAGPCRHGSLRRRITMQAPRIPVAWNLTGGTPLPSGAPDAVYWRRHLREPVRFADGIAHLRGAGYRTFLEVGPHPTLLALAQQTLQDDTLSLPSLRRDHDDWTELTASLAQLYVHGARIDWAGVGASDGGHAVALPTYPFERHHYWVSAASEIERRPLPGRKANPLAGERLPTAAVIFETTLSPEAPAWLAEHRVRGAVLVPGPVFLELAQAAARDASGAALREIENFVIHAPLVLGDQGRAVQVHLREAVDGVTPFAIHSRATDADGAWQLHAEGRLCDGAATPAGAAVSITALQAALGDGRDGDDYYARLAEVGIDLGTSCRSLRRTQQRDGEVLARIVLPVDRRGDDVTVIHPVLLDGALQACELAVPQSVGRSDLYLATAIDRITLAAPLPVELWCRVRLRPVGAADPAEWRADVTLYNDDGATVGALHDVCLSRASPEALDRAPAANDLFYRLVWEQKPLPVLAAPALASPDRLLPRQHARFAALAHEHGLAIYDALIPELDRLCSMHVSAALKELGFDATVGRRFTVDIEITRLKLAPHHARLFARMLAMLAEDGVLHRRGELFEIVAPLDTTDPAARYAMLLDRFRGRDDELRILHRCGSGLAAVLASNQDPLQLLFPDGALDEMRRLYAETPYARTFNGTLAETVAAAISELPATARLRVIEIGAGTGATTAQVLPLLPADRTDYLFTDVSPVFLDHAAEAFAGTPFLRRALLDIERDPSSQGFAADSADIVIAVNVLHATADLRQAVRHALHILAPGGLLILLEGVAPERWADLSFGLTEGWWRFTDTNLRIDYPLLSRDAWNRLLEAEGLTAISMIPAASTGSRIAAQQALIVARAPSARRQWTLIGDQDGVGGALAARLRARGDTVTSLPATAPATEAAGTVVYLGALVLASRSSDDVDAVVACKDLACACPLRWLATISNTTAASRVYLVTQGAQPVGDAMAPGGRWQAPLWGLGRVFALERPGSFGGLIDLPPVGSAENLAETLLGSLENADDEDQTAWRGGVRYVARLVPTTPPGAPPWRLRADATYLITGGFGGLGVLVARDMAERGARHIALLGRHPDPDSDAVRAIERAGAKVIALAGDVADMATMRALLAQLAREAPPLRGIVHAAADVSTAPIGELTAAQVDAMLRVKLDGTVILEALTRDLSLDFVVLFSSTTALIGATGFAHYAAASLFLDATAQMLNTPNRRVLSVNWGRWSTMRLASADTHRSYSARGLVPMPTSQALNALGALIGGNDAQQMVARIDWSVLKPLHEARRPQPLLSKVEGAVRPTPQPEARQQIASLAKRLAGAAANMREEILLDFVRGEVAKVLDLETAAPVSLELGLFEMGMDSLMSVELKRRLERGVGHTLPSTLTFNYPNIKALVTFLMRDLPGVANAGPDVSAAAGAASAAQAVGAASADIDDLTDSEIEARLLARLEETR